MRFGLRRSRTRRGISGSSWQPEMIGASVFSPADTVPYLVAGQVVSWTSRDNKYTLTDGGVAARRPTYSATGLGGAYPGVTGDGVDDYLDSLTSLDWAGTGGCFFANMIDTTGAISVVFESGVGSSAGSASVFVNNAANNVEAACAAPLAVYGGPDALASARSVVVRYDRAQTLASVFDIRSDGATLALSPVIAATATGNFAPQTFGVFRRSGGTFPWAGNLGDWGVIPTRPSDADAARLTSWLAARRGVVL